MNRTWKKIAALALCLSLAAGMAACAQEEQPNAIDQMQTIVSNTWQAAESPVVTEELQALLEKAAEGMTGAEYVPVAYLGTQFAADASHMLLCRVTPVVPDAVETYAIAMVYEDAEGGAELTSVSDFGMETFLGSETLAGGWSEPETPELPDEVTEAFEKAKETQTDILYHPVALLSQQVVSGMNYRVLCEADDAIPGYDTNYAILTLYSALDGSAEITDIAKCVEEEQEK
ncbi:MAG: hypothetical protein K5772_04610 [Clostridia bacterium]|nr:hypothetical protein [Clostridia bacterium]